MHERQQLGGAGEAAAVNYLTGLGYRILFKNWHAGRYGEIDIVASNNGSLVVVEVKTRQQIKFGYPENAVNRAKLKKLRLAAQSFMVSHPQFDGPVRLEVIAIVVNTERVIVDLKHYQSLYLDDKFT
ncbi:MAG: YraN family protein [Patescibacteria group bacterium]